MNEIIRLLVAILEKHGVAYMIAGGQAVVKWGEPRYTKDVDVTVQLTPDRVSFFRSILEPEFKPMVKDPDQFVHESWVLPMIHVKSGTPVDFTFTDTGFEKSAIKRAARVMVDGTEVRFIGVEDLIVEKLFAGRGRDLDDVRGIVNARRSSLDLAYVASNLEAFDRELAQNDLIEIWKSILSELEIKGDH